MLHTNTSQIDLSQRHLIGKFALFLEKYQPEKKELIIKLKAAIADGSKGGLCSGFASVALYGLWLENQPAPGTAATSATAVATSSASSNVFESKQIPNEARVDPRLSVFTGDWRWSTVNDILKKISGWDGNTHLSKDDLHDFDRVIRQVTYFHFIDNHLPVAQGNLAESFADDRGNKMHQEFAIGGLLNYMDFVNKKVPAEQNSTVSSKARVMHLFTEYNPVLISTHNHATCVLKTPKKFFCYNVNNPKGMIEFDSQDDKAISTLLKTIYVENQLGGHNSAPIGLRVFRFNGEPRIYPAHADFLQALPVMPKDKKDYDNFTALHIAAKIGSLESTNFYLTPSKDIPAETIAKLVDAPDASGRTAVFLAAQSGFADILLSLHQAKANMDIPDAEGTAPLFMACQANHVKAAAILLKLNVNPNKQTAQGATALHIAAERGHVDIVKLLLGNKANPFMISDKKDLLPVDKALDNKHAEVALALLFAMEKFNLDEYKAYMKNLSKPRLDFLLAIKAHAAERANVVLPNPMSSAMLPNSLHAHSKLQSAAAVAVALHSAPVHSHADTPKKISNNKSQEAPQAHASPAVVVQARREPTLRHTPSRPNPREHEDRIENDTYRNHSLKNK
jgi:hypothetical protein